MPVNEGVGVHDLLLRAGLEAGNAVLEARLHPRGAGVRAGQPLLVDVGHGVRLQAAALVVGPAEEGGLRLDVTHALRPEALEVPHHQLGGDVRIVQQRAERPSPGRSRRTPESHAARSRSDRFVNAV